MSGLLAQVVVMAGPSGSGKSHLAESSGLPVLELDHFYKDGDDPTAPRHHSLGIVDWDDVRSWNADKAIAALDELCRTGTTQIPVYDIAQDRAVGAEPFSLNGAAAVIAEGIFSAELVAPLRARGLLADAIVVRRAAWKNFARRLQRDLRERRKPPATLVRRGLALMQAEEATVRRQIELGCRPCDRHATVYALRHAARGEGLDRPPVPPG
jgi:uridine kinase